MAQVLLNGKENNSEILISYNNRSFQFGDGVFETIIVHQDEIRFSKDHYDRLISGMSALHLDSELLSFNSFENQILKCLHINDLSSARIKFMVYRKTSKEVGYKSTVNKFDTLLIVRPLSNLQIVDHNMVSASNNVTLAYSAYSKFKTMSSLPYVLAELEKKEKHLDEIVLMDTHQQVSECSSSNIFWIKDDLLWTSPLSTGCKDGIMRKRIMGLVNTIEKEISYDELTKSQSIFCTNVARLGILSQIDQTKLNTTHTILSVIKPLWEL